MADRRDDDVTRAASVASVFSLSLACSADAMSNAWIGRPALDPDNAGVALVDRFSPAAGVLAVRSESNGLPAPGEPIDFDRSPFLVRGFGPRGEHIRYYDLDIKSQVPAALYVLTRGGSRLSGQLPILSRLPGDAGYNDFWRVHEVDVPEGYRENSMVGERDVVDSGFLVTPTSRIVHRAVVPPESSALLRYDGAENGLGRAWYGGQVASFLSFEEAVSSVRGLLGEVAVGIAYIWVTFNLNADQPGGGPASGVMQDASGVQTHNVADSLPGESRYSPLWMAITYDNAAFPSVMDRDSAERAAVVAGVGSPLINCPVVAVDP